MPEEELLAVLAWPWCLESFDLGFFLIVTMTLLQYQRVA